MVWGTPQRLINEEDPTLDFQMLLHIMANDYRSIRHMILAGWRPKEARNCGFSLTLNDMKHWEVSDATMLHFALCSGLFEAAIVLLVAFPEHAEVACRAREQSGEERLWTPRGLADFLILTFSHQPEKMAAYSATAALLRRLEEDRASFPFVNILSTAERLVALGPCAASALAVLLSKTGVEK